MHRGVESACRLRVVRDAVWMLTLFMCTCSYVCVWRVGAHRDAKEEAREEIYVVLFLDRVGPGDRGGREMEMDTLGER